MPRDTKSWRPRFSVRTLAIVVTLACVYFGLWTLTQREAARQYSIAVDKTTRFFDDENSTLAIMNSRSPLPLLISRDEVRFERPGLYPRCYYLWLFGPMVKLPLES